MMHTVHETIMANDQVLCVVFRDRLAQLLPRKSSCFIQRGPHFNGTQGEVQMIRMAWEAVAHLDGRQARFLGM